MAHNDASSFAAQIDAEMSECNAALARLIVKIVGEALARIIERTPVDSGKARGGWGVTVAGTGSQAPVSLPAKDRDGAVTLRNGLAELLGYGKDGKFPVISIGNDVPYIHILEYGSRGSAPHAMVSLVLAELMVEYGG